MNKMRFFLTFLILIYLSKSIYGSNLFDTSYYNVEFKSKNIEKNKIEKIEYIKLDSLNKIFEKILIIEDYSKIIRTIDIDLMNTFIKNISIEDEKIIDNNYYSKIKINYDKFKLIEYLRNNKISYTEYLPSQFLTIIFEKNQLNKNILTKNSDYYNFLKNNLNNFNFNKIPKIDINDKYLLNNVEINNNNNNKFDEILNKYNLSNAIIIISQTTNKKKNYQSYIYTNNKVSFVNDYKLTKLNYSKLFTDINNDIIDSWKKQNSIDNTKISKLDCDINYFNLNELKEIKKIIRETSTIKDFNLKEISLNKNQYEISYYGDSKFLYKLFRANRLDIKFDNTSCEINLK